MMIMAVFVVIIDNDLGINKSFPSFYVKCIQSLYIFSESQRFSFGYKPLTSPPELTSSNHIRVTDDK